MSNSIQLSNVSKRYRTNNTPFIALDRIDLSLEQGDFVSIVGKSGSGKSTLLNLMSGIDQPSSGQVIVNGIDIAHMKTNFLDAWRGKNIGLVFQFFQLLPTLTALENILLAMDFCKVISAAKRVERARCLLQRVGISDKANQFPSLLSGGEKQRVAIARALANDPPIILADEPTGNLDSANAKSIFGLLTELNHQGKTIVLVSHDPDCHLYSNRSIHIIDGRITVNQKNAG